MKSIVTLRGVSFELPDGTALFHNLNFTLEARLTALLGPNGVGKTTLAKIIAEEKGVRYFPQREIAPPVSVEELLAPDYPWSELGENLLSPVNRATLCSELSGGEWMRVRLARSLSEGFLILDEPTNDLDFEGRRAVRQFLRQQQSGVLLISHDRECLALCEDILELSNQGLQKFGGGFSSYLEARDQERENSLARLERAKQERGQSQITRQEQISRQDKRNRKGALHGASGSIPRIVAGGLKRRAQATTGKIKAETLARANESVREAYEAHAALKSDPLMYADFMGREIPAQKLVAEARNFNIRYDEWLYPQDLNFVWRGNLKLALKGANGSGKSSLLKVLMGAKPETRGEFRRGNLSALYLDQKCSTLKDGESIFENVRETSRRTESEIRNALAKFLFAQDKVFQKVESLSGGERLRAALAKGLLSTDSPELLVLDEPTNNLDLLNIEFLENLLRKFSGALLLISHDETFLKNCGVNQELELIVRERN